MNLFIRTVRVRKIFTLKTKDRYKSNVDEISKDVGNEKYSQLYVSTTFSNNWFDAINHQRNEAFTTLRINLPNKPKGKHVLKLYIDNGASENTLPVGTVMQIYPQLEPNKTKLTAYNGEHIKCIGKFTIDVHHSKICFIPCRGCDWLDNCWFTHM